MKDKYSAIWVSHSSIGDYLKCPRAYYLRNVYRDPKTNHKISLMAPALALGQIVHEVIESLSTLPVEERFTQRLIDRYAKSWEKVSGERGGFASAEEEEKFRIRGEEMIARVVDHPGPLTHKTIKIRQELPYFWLSEEDNIILCGKIDWLEYLEESDSVRIVDFKTGKFDEEPDSLQLPIYYLLASRCQTKPVTGISYWYLNRDPEPVAMDLPDKDDAITRILEYAKRIALARKLGRFVCKDKDGCRACRPLEAIVSGKAKLVGVNDFGQDLYVLLSA
ncbi:MAG: PD-(D/E)XK nuclease family protein [Candidatus Gottesmanbacteria bacterium]|nr:PD-(D/E)XK nuclease family protein [Candidatus Gottesmanbacteria bacterium]